MGSDMYKFVATINKARQSAQTWESDYVERYVLDNFFAYSFGNMLVLTTNSSDTVSVNMPYLPYSPGTQVCNAFDSSDCLTVESDGSSNWLNVSVQGTPKIYLPADSEYFANQLMFL